MAEFAGIYLDYETWAIAGRSLLVSALASFIALDVALILAALLLRTRNRVALGFEALMAALMALPAVVIGLLGLMFFSSALFVGTQINLTIVPMVAAQSVLLLPLATTLILQVLRARDAMIGEELRALGAGRAQSFDALMGDTWPSLLAVGVLVFSRGIAEVGTVLIVGGGLDSRTEVLTTKIAELASVGAYENAIALALILIVLALILTLIVRRLETRS